MQFSLTELLIYHRLCSEKHSSSAPQTRKQKTEEGNRCVGIAILEYFTSFLCYSSFDLQTIKRKHSFRRNLKINILFFFDNSNIENVSHNNLRNLDRKHLATR